MRLDFLSASLQEPLRKALSPQPEDRFSSCMSFVEALRDALLPFVREKPSAHKWLSEWPRYEPPPVIPLNKGSQVRTVPRKLVELTHPSKPVEVVPTRVRLKRRPKQPLIDRGWFLLGVLFVPFLLLGGWTGWLLGKRVSWLDFWFPDKAPAVDTSVIIIILLPLYLLTAIVINGWTDRLHPLTFLESRIEKEVTASEE
jgi:hypothetical protein